jgi:hypothetical protein
MSFKREVQNWNRMLSDLRLDPPSRGKRRNGTCRQWILKSLPVKPMKTADFLRKAEREGMLKGSVWAALIRLIDDGLVSEDRYRREIWRP